MTDYKRLAAVCRRWKLAAIGLALAAGLAISARADLPYQDHLRVRAVETNEVVLRDDSGRVRARLAMHGNAARLILLDENGKVVASLPEQARVVPLGH